VLFFEVALIGDLISVAHVRLRITVTRQLGRNQSESGPRSQRAAKQGDELTSLQWAELHMLPLAGEVRGSIADWRGSSQGLIAMRDFGPAERRSGS